MLCFFLGTSSRHKEPSQDITEDDVGEANDVLDNDTPEVSDQTEAFEEAIETLIDDDGEILISIKLVVTICTHPVCTIY